MGKDIFPLKNIIGYCEDIKDAIDRFGGEEDFAEDRHYRDLCSFYISQIGENIKHLSKRSKDKYPEIKWDVIREARDDVAHVYHTIDFDLIWFTITEEIPILKETCEKILKDLRS